MWLGWEMRWDDTCLAGYNCDHLEQGRQSKCIRMIRQSNSKSYIFLVKYATLVDMRKLVMWQL